MTSTIHSPLLKQLLESYPIPPLVSDKLKQNNVLHLYQPFISLPKYLNIHVLELLFHSPLHKIYWFQCSYIMLRVYFMLLLNVCTVVWIEPSICPHKWTDIPHYVNGLFLMTYALRWNVKMRLQKVWPICAKRKNIYVNSHDLTIRSIYWSIHCKVSGVL